MKTHGRSLVSWCSKKQNSVALSTTTKADSCYAQLLWMRATLLDYEIKLDEVPMLCDNERAMKI